MPSAALVPSSHPRDDFPPNVRDPIAKRAGYICSYPGCRRMTVARSEDRTSGLTMVGVAAHIAAAAPGGPRYDPSMRHDERVSESNGIWVCQIHSKFIDDNPSRCSTEELQRWKRQHERWVFDRVASGAELFTSGVTRIRFSNVGIFDSATELSLGRHNILVGRNEAGKTTFCQILAAFSGRPHWATFNSRFDFDRSSTTRSFIAATYASRSIRRTVELSPQPRSFAKRSKRANVDRIHIAIDGNTAADWPKSFFRTLHFDDQLQESARHRKEIFIRAVRYLADVFTIDYEIVFDSLREETYANSVLGFRFRRKSIKDIEVLVPDGREFYLPPTSLSTSELCLAVIDIALKLVLCSASEDHWLLLFDTGFFGRLDEVRKLFLFSRMTNFNDRAVQTIFCLNDEEDAETLKQVQLDRWINGSQFGRLTLHAFL